MSPDTRLSIPREKVCRCIRVIREIRVLATVHSLKSTRITRMPRMGASLEVVAGVNRVVLFGSETRLNFRCLICRFFDTVPPLPTDRPDPQSFPAPLIIPFRRPGER